jgi:hypothetical protein
MRRINALYDQMEETAGGIPQGLWWGYVSVCFYETGLEC